MSIYNLKNISAFHSRNGYGMTATLTVNDIDVCTMRDAGDGSQPVFDVLNDAIFRRLKRVIDDMPPIFIEQYGSKMKIDLGMFIDLLHYALETKTEFKLLEA